MQHHTGPKMSLKRGTEPQQPKIVVSSSYAKNCGFSVTMSQGISKKNWRIIPKLSEIECLFEHVQPPLEFPVQTYQTGYV